MSNEAAVIVGATGAIGRKLVPLLAAAPHYAKVVIVHRRPTPFAKLAKVDERIMDLRGLPPEPLAISAGSVFCCIGTTQKKAGSTAAFQAVDRDIPVALARWAADHEARVLVVVSSLGANALSGSVYLRTKGEMEEGVARAGVRSVYILRPSLLKGERDEFRLAERVGNRAMAIVGPLMAGPLRKYRSVPTEMVARVMLACAKRAEPGVHIVESDAIQDLDAEGTVAGQRA